MPKVTRGRGERVWLEAPETAHAETPIEAKKQPARIAYHGLVVNCIDESQGTYAVENSLGDEWLVITGADRVLEISEKTVDGNRSNRQVLAAVRIYQKRN